VVQGEGSNEGTGFISKTGLQNYKLSISQNGLSQVLMTFN